LILSSLNEQPASQDYLKAIHRITEGKGRDARANTKAIAAELHVSQPSVSAMLDRLAAANLVDYVHYGGVQLSADGRRAALRVIRRHRLLELYLTRFLGLRWDEVHEEAEQLEHVLSERVEAAIDKALDHPDFDPHGDPIPSPSGSLPSRASRTLWSAEQGDEGVVARVSDADPGLLRHLDGMGVVPGAVVTVTRRDSGGMLRLRVDGRNRALGREAAEMVYVSPTRGVRRTGGRHSGEAKSA
jgi:DtxR family Mn-dependent transcriptional regulator